MLFVSNIFFIQYYHIFVFHGEKAWKVITFFQLCVEEHEAGASSNLFLLEHAA